MDNKFCLVFKQHTVIKKELSPGVLVNERFFQIPWVLLRSGKFIDLKPQKLCFN